MDTSLEGIEREKAQKRMKETQFKPGQSGKHYEPTKIYVSQNDKNRLSSREVNLETKEIPQSDSDSYEIAKRIGCHMHTKEERN